MQINSQHIKRKLYQYFIQRLGMKKYRRGWLKGDCPSCGEHKFGVSLSLMKTNCFKCGYNQKPLEVIMDYENLIEQSEALKVLNNFEGLDFYEEKVELYQQKENVILPEGYMNILFGDGLRGINARKYLKSRGFNIKEIAKAGWGYCTKDKYDGYIIMPFYKKGKLIYFNARRYMFDGPRFNNPLIEDFGIGKSMLLYNIDCLSLYKKVFIVEGLMNARTIGDNSVATGGKKISKYQINTLIKSPVEKFVIGFDNDGLHDAIKLALRLVNYKKVKIMMFEDEKDINDLGRNKSLKIARSNKYLTYRDLIKLRNEHC